MTHEEAMSQIGSALPYLNPKVADEQGVVYVRAMIQFVRDANGELTRQWRYQQVDIGEEQWNPPNKPKKQCMVKPKFNWLHWREAPTRVKNLAYRLKPESMQAMSKYKRSDLLMIRGVGKKTVDEMEAFLHSQGYSLAL
jgi:hypothetical protein